MSPSTRPNVETFERETGWYWRLTDDAELELAFAARPESTELEARTRGEVAAGAYMPTPAPGTKPGPYDQGTER